MNMTANSGTFTEITPRMANSKMNILNYSDIFFTFFVDNETACINQAKFHHLIYVYEGEIAFSERGKETVVSAGQCVFVRRDHRVTFTKRPAEGKQYKGVTMIFKRNFLREYYQELDYQNFPKDVLPFEESVRLLPNHPSIQSLFQSISPYFDANVKPTDEIAELKMKEGILALFNMDERYYPTLFDFTEPWKIDILDFLNENYMFEFTLDEIASYTGRSLATFKRDFKKISEMPPQKWLIHKRLEVAYRMIKEEGRKITEVCMDVGFKNRSHFTTAFKKQYGYAPSAGPEVN